MAARELHHRTLLRAHAYGTAVHRIRRHRARPLHHLLPRPLRRILSPAALRHPTGTHPQPRPRLFLIRHSQVSPPSPLTTQRTRSAKVPPSHPSLDPSQIVTRLLLQVHLSRHRHPLPGGSPSPHPANLREPLPGAGVPHPSSGRAQRARSALLVPPVLGFDRCSRLRAATGPGRPTKIFPPSTTNNIAHHCPFSNDLSVPVLIHPTPSSSMRVRPPLTHLTLPPDPPWARAEYDWPIPRAFTHYSPGPCTYDPSAPRERNATTRRPNSPQSSTIPPPPAPVWGSSSPISTLRNSSSSPPTSSSTLPTNKRPRSQPRTPSKSPGSSSVYHQTFQSPSSTPPSTRTQ